MKNGGWIPLSKGFVMALPHNRKFTELEAAFSLQLDYDNGNTVTLSGYASRWHWSKDKVRRFISKMGAEIRYPKPTSNIRKQRGILSSKNHLEQISVPSRSRLILSCNSNKLSSNTSLKPSRTDISTVQKHTTTIDPNPIKNLSLLDKSKEEEVKFYKTKEEKLITGQQLEWFNGFWEAWNSHHLYKNGKADSGDAWLDLKVNKNLYLKIIRGAEIESRLRQSKIDKGSTPKYPQGWLSGRRWEDYDEYTNSSSQENRVYDVTPDLLKYVEELKSE